MAGKRITQLRHIRIVRKVGHIKAAVEEAMPFAAEKLESHIVALCDLIGQRPRSSQIAITVPVPEL